MLWRTDARCPCCYKKTVTVLDTPLNETAPGWNNWIGREHAARFARDGVCPWCGRKTTIVAKILLRRFEPTLRDSERVYA